MQTLKIVNSICILLICSILIGALYFQFGLHENPCPLCLLQRMAMMAVIFGLGMNIYFGFKPQHFALIIMAALVGLTMSARQVLLHICPVDGEPTGYGSPVFGMHLYTWGVFIFLMSILASAIFIMIIPKIEAKPELKIIALEKFAVYLTIAIILINIIATFFECQLGPCCENGPCP